MESIMIGVMIVLMGALMIFGGHRMMMGGHGDQGHEAKTSAPAAVTNAVTNAPAPQGHHQDSPAH